ncbi:hypothetical protein IWW36_002498 [Coemansia brasiliensis]|uniref:Uncharacterized protein n=1 Tax=Coemansia brasiliensis TaxID=2650707 RepID=A0A9W8I7V1_9FUNG|nr:hypothetical protein IWW36_002498 [Coemansia brasiliensis]
MAEHTHDDSDYSIIDQAGMSLNHAPSGLYLPGIDSTTHREAVRLCARDYLEHHVFFNHRGFHNHLNHHLLAVFTLGAPTTRLQEIFDLQKGMQRPSYSLESEVDINDENFAQYFSDERHYPNFVRFFQRKLESAGDSWKKVACNYFFHPQIFPLGMSGLFHPLIQFGYGLEFESQAITATALAQACVHSPSYNKLFSPDTFAEICSQPGKSNLSLMQLLEQIRQDQRKSDLDFTSEPYRHSGITAFAEELAITYSKMWSLSPTKEAIDAKYHELLSTVALIYGSLTKPGYQVVLHFVLMHCLTSAYFLPIIMDCLPLEKQAKLLKAHCAATLATFVVHGCPNLYITPEISSTDTHVAVSDSQGNINNQWLDVFAKAIANNDMHVAKVIRGLWRGSLLNAFPNEQPTCKDDYELPPPINWLYLARTTVDTITADSFNDMDKQLKEGKYFWKFGVVGSDEFWKNQKFIK